MLGKPAASLKHSRSYTTWWFLPKWLEPRCTQPQHNPSFSDLLQGAKHGLLHPVSQTAGVPVVLRVECVNAVEAKIGASVVSVAAVFSYAAVIILTVIKVVDNQKEPLTILRSDAYDACCIALGGLCLIVVSIRLGWLTQRVRGTLRQGMIWTPRRIRVAGMAVFIACIQIINLISWILPHVYLQIQLHSTPQKCSWFSTMIDVCGVIRFTCWNTLFLTYLIMGNSLLPWRPRHVSKAVSQEHLDQLLMLECPLRIHLPKLLLWMIYEVLILMIIAPSYFLQQYSPTHLPTIAYQNQPCRKWDWVAVCNTSNFTYGATSGIAGLSALYILWYASYIVRAYMELRKRPCTEVRAASMLLSLQTRSVFLAYKVMAVSIVILWFVQTKTCWSYVTTWTGLLPMQIMAAALAWELCWLFMPVSPASDPVQQVLLQDFAWTEAEVPAKLQQRVMHGQGLHEKQQLQAEPLFCLETAFKLQRWSNLAYSAAGEDEQRIQRTSGSNGRRSSGSLFCWPEGSCAGCLGCCGCEESNAPLQHDKPPLGREKSFLSRAAGLTGVGQADSEEEEPNLEGVVVNTMQRSAAVHPKAAADTQQQLSVAMALYDLTEFKSFWDPQLEIKALMAWNRKTVVLTFRGTASMANAMSDLKVWRIPHTPRRGMFLAGTMPLVHSGFYRAWLAQGLDQQVVRHLRSLYKSEQVNRDARVLLTGHSLGGALAMLAAHDMACQLQLHNIEVYSYGSPYPGNHAFARDFDRQIKDCWHVIHDQDPVPRTGKLLCLFKRPGNRVIINRRGQMLVRPNPLELQVQGGKNIAHHWLRNYRAAMVAFCMAQFGKQGLTGGPEGVHALGSLPSLRRDLETDGVEWDQLQKAAGYAFEHPSISASGNANAMA